MKTIKTAWNALKQIFALLFLPAWGSNRRRAQEEYERALDEGRLPE